MRVCTCGGSAGVFAESGVVMAFDLVFLRDEPSHGGKQQHQQRQECTIEKRRRMRLVWRQSIVVYNQTSCTVQRVAAKTKSSREERGGPRLIRIRSSVALPKRDGDTSMIRPGLPDVDPGWLSQSTGGGGSRCQCRDCAQLGWA